MATTFQLVETDRGALVADAFLRMLAHDGQPADHALAWSALTGERDTLAWLMERNGAPAGVAVLELGPADTASRRAYIRCLFVAPAHRGLGLGELAREFMQCVAATHGARLVTREDDPSLRERKLPDLMRRAPSAGVHDQTQMRAA